MNFAAVGWLAGVVGLGLSVILAVPLGVAAVLGEAWAPFGIAVLTTLLVAGLLVYRGGGPPKALSHREAFLAVSAVWLLVCAVGAIPFVAYPEPELSLIDSLFESVSGFTTTGATVLSGLDTLPRSLLLWRAMMQWIGGMGIVVFGVAILPLLGVGGMQLYRAEVPGPSSDKLTPRVGETAKLLWALYLGLTLAAGVLFLVGGMSPFDALAHAMTSVSTAGFSTHDQSLGFYDSHFLHFVATLTMLTGGTSFVVLHRAVTGGTSLQGLPELRAYFGIFAVATAVIATDLWANMSTQFPTVLDALIHGSFQAASILTTTGYSTRDFNTWPGASHAVFLALFFVGGMAGSTSGGPKVIRVLVLWRVGMLQFFRLVHRRGVDVVRIGPRTVGERVVASSLGFLSMWLLLLFCGTAAIAAGGTDLMSSFSGAAVSLANIGPGLGAIGPAETFAPLDTPTKLVMVTLMVLGRLEIYTLLVVLTPTFWRF